MNNITFKQLRNLTEDQARELLEAVRWPNGAICPRCGSDRAHKLEPKTEGKTHVRAGVYFCGACRKQFTVTVGTVMERSQNQDCRLAHGFLSGLLIQERHFRSSTTPNSWNLL